MKILSLYAAVLFFTGIAAPTVGADQAVDTFVNLSTIPSCSSAFDDNARFVNTNQLGLSVQNLHRHEIFRFDSKKAPWRPINGFRETLCGQVAKYFVATVHPDQNEHDWNIDITPALPFARSLGASKVECEVTPAAPLRNNDFFPPKGSGRPSLLLGRSICVYGPWVRDLGNDGQREIHPTEAIWWRDFLNSSAIDVMLIQDSSIHRFTEFADYDFDEDHDGTVDSNLKWVPWVRYPQMEEIKIPFRYDPNAAEFSVISIETPRDRNVVTDGFPELADSDDGSAHRLKPRSVLPAATNHDVFAEVHEDITQHTGIQFSDLCRSANGGVNGNIRVLVALGRPNTRDAGYLVLRFKKSAGANKPVLHK